MGGKRCAKWVGSRGGGERGPEEGGKGTIGKSEMERGRHSYEKQRGEWETLVSGLVLFPLLPPTHPHARSRMSSFSGTLTPTDGNARGLLSCTPATQLGGNQPRSPEAHIERG